jgi:hypothetical protein
MLIVLRRDRLIWRAIFMQRLRVLDATVLSNVDVPRLMQLREDSLFVRIGDAALKLKHGGN